MPVKEESFSDNLMAISDGAPLKYDDKISFASAFAHARKIFGEEGLFIHQGKVYSTKGPDMKPEPAAEGMEDNPYAQSQEGAPQGEQSQDTSTSTDSAESGQPSQKPQPKFKKKPSKTETNAQA